MRKGVVFFVEIATIIFPAASSQLALSDILRQCDISRRRLTKSVAAEKSDAPKKWIFVKVHSRKKCTRRRVTEAEGMSAPPCSFFDSVSLKGVVENFFLGLRPPFRPLAPTSPQPHFRSMSPRQIWQDLRKTNMGRGLTGQFQGNCYRGRSGQTEGRRRMEPRRQLGGWPRGSS